MTSLSQAARIVSAVVAGLVVCGAAQADRCGSCWGLNGPSLDGIQMGLTHNGPSLDGAVHGRSANGPSLDGGAVSR